MTGDDYLTERAQLMLTGQPTQALFCCGDPSCAYSVLTWQDELPAFTHNRRGWPKCPEGHKARFVSPFQPQAEG